MMISKITTTISVAIKDRVFLTLAIILAALMVLYCLYLGFSLHPTDVQVAVRYTAFGATTYYRDQWYYLTAFIVFVLGGGLLNLALGVRLQNLERPQLSRGWIAIAITLVLMAFVLTHSVLGISYL